MISFHASTATGAADISFVDMEKPIPRALAVVEALSSSAVDEALASALVEMDTPVQKRAFDLLVHRGHVAALAEVVGSFHTAPSSIQALVVGAHHGLEPGFRTAIESTSFSQRAGAIEAIVAADAVELAHLLVDALRGTCAQTRDIAAKGLVALVDSVFDPDIESASAYTPAQRVARTKSLMDALGYALHGWELHNRRDVLEAALRCGRHIVPSVKRKLALRPVRIDRPMADILRCAHDPRHAEFLWCALAIPRLRSSAVEVIEALRDPALIRAVLAHAWLLNDPSIAAGFREVRSCRWLCGKIEGLPLIDGCDAVSAASLIVAAGTRYADKLERFAALLREGSESVQRAVMWCLVEDQTNGATELLRVFADRSCAAWKDIIRRELDHRERTSGPSSSGHRDKQRIGIASPTGLPDALDALFERFDRITPEERRSTALAYHRQTGQLEAGLRKRLRSSTAQDRRQGLLLIRELGWTESFEEYVCQMGHDRDAQVRSLAVAMLAGLPGATTNRILRMAINDPDERVQANAIEALDRLNVPRRL